jgi:catechol 2,3-dioxygenase-like lactoylglutathione lyase family enzyme
MTVMRKMTFGAALVVAMVVSSITLASDQTGDAVASGVRAVGPIGLSVRDIDRSTRFYASLGFKAGDKEPMPSSAARAVGARGRNPTLIMREMTRDGAKLLLIQLHPTPSKPAGSGAAAQLGLAHLDFNVDDIDRVASEIERMGGSVLKATRAKLTDAGPNPIETLYCRDPDGTLIILVHLSS